MKIKFILNLLIIFILQSCNINSQDIDYIIEKYNEEDFSCLKEAFVNVRGGINEDTIVILISKNNSKCSPYIVTVNYNTGKVLKVNDTLPKRDCNGYFTMSEIENFTKCFFKYKFQVLSVDSEGNVYINPNQQNLPTLLRKVENENVTPKDIKDFKMYKGNWYIRK